MADGERGCTIAAGIAQDAHIRAVALYVLLADVARSAAGGDLNPIIAVLQNHDRLTVDQLAQFQALRRGLGAQNDLQFAADRAHGHRIVFNIQRVIHIAEGFLKQLQLMVYQLLFFCGGDAGLFMIAGGLEDFHGIHQRDVVYAVQRAIVQLKFLQCALQTGYHGAAHALGERDYVFGDRCVIGKDQFLQRIGGNAVLPHAQILLQILHGGDHVYIIGCVFAIAIVIAQSIQAQQQLAKFGIAVSIIFRHFTHAEEFLIRHAAVLRIGGNVQQLAQLFLAIAAFDDVHARARAAVLRDVFRVLLQQTDAAVRCGIAEFAHRALHAPARIAALPIVGDGMEQIAALDARRPAGIAFQIGEIIPWLAFGAAIGRGQIVYAFGRGIVYAGGAEHLTNHFIIRRAIDRYDLAGNIHLNPKRRFIRLGGEGENGGQKQRGDTQRRKKFPCKHEKYLNLSSVSMFHIITRGRAWIQAFYQPSSSNSRSYSSM